MKILISIPLDALKFLNIYSPLIKFCGKELLCNTEYKQEVSDFLLSYNGSAPKKCSRFTEGATEIRQPSKYRIILFENLCN
jgi:hypothetical protein